MPPPLLSPLNPHQLNLSSSSILLSSAFASSTITSSSNRISRRHVSSARRTTKLLRHKPGISAAHAARASTPRTPSAALADHIIFNPPSAAPSLHHTPPLFLPPEDPRRGLLVQAATHANPYAVPVMVPARVRAPTVEMITAMAAAAPAALDKTSATNPVEGMSALVALHYERQQQKQQLQQQLQQNLHQIPNQPSSTPSSPTPITTTSTSSALPPAIRKSYQKTYHLNEAQIAEIRALRAADPWQWTRARLAEKFGCTQFFIGMCVPASEQRKKWGTDQLEQSKARWGPKRLGAREERVKRRETWARDE